MVWLAKALGGSLLSGALLICLTGCDATPQSKGAGNEPARDATPRTEAVVEPGAKRPPPATAAGPDLPANMLPAVQKFFECKAPDVAPLTAGGGLDEVPLVGHLTHLEGKAGGGEDTGPQYATYAAPGNLRVFGLRPERLFYAIVEFPEAMTLLPASLAQVEARLGAPTASLPDSQDVRERSAQVATLTRGKVVGVKAVIVDGLHVAKLYALGGDRTVVACASGFSMDW